MRELTFAPLQPADLKAILLQPSQRDVLGIPAEAIGDQSELLCNQRVAWAARDGERVVACFGIAETFPGRHGIAWAMLADGIGRAHLALTRFVRAQIARCDLPRLELLTRAPDIEAEIAEAAAQDFGGFNQAGLIRRAFRFATPEMRWALLLGMRPAYLARCFGAASESCMLFERIDPARIPAEREIA